MLEWLSFPCERPRNALCFFFPMSNLRLLVYWEARRILACNFMMNDESFKADILFGIIVVSALWLRCTQLCGQ